VILEIENLSVDLGEFKLNDVSLKVNERDYVTIIGPTGSGKSILLETIAGFYKPLKGRIVLEGRDITLLPPEKRCVSIVYQDFALFPHMNVFKNIAYGLRKRERSDSVIREEVGRIAEILGIAHLLHRKPTTLSGGEQQRVAIARALVVKPKILLMDEPFSALDVKMRENLRKLVRKAVREYDTTVLHVTHDFEDVFSLANRVVVMKNGRIMQMGKPEDVFSKPSNDFVADFVGTNILEGVVIGKENGFTLIKVGEHVLYSADHAEVGEVVRVSIRPESVMLSNECSAKNTFLCLIEGIKRGTNLVWLTLRSGDLRFKVVTTPSFVDAMGIDVGKSVFASFKAVNVKIVRS
jgi:molybdate transport system ATP-binding protein